MAGGAGIFSGVAVSERRVTAEVDEESERRTEEEKTRLFVELRRRQLGAFTRAQAIEHGITDQTLKGRCRRRQIQRVYSGVYLDFTGPIPWASRVWAAWLACGPAAALTGATALRWFGFDGDWSDEAIHIAVPHTRRVNSRPGIILSRHRDLPNRVQDNREPPTVRLEVALLLVASAETTTARQAAILLDSCRQRRTTPDRLLAELKSLSHLPRRRVLRSVLTDAAAGAQSFLEQTYLRRVERAHGLPTGERQVRVGGVSAAGRETTNYRDVQYTEYGTAVELDGLVGHTDALSRWQDMSRDNSALLNGKRTLRFGYGLVSRPCETAAQVVAALHLGGWTGTPHPCTSPTCPFPPRRADLGKI
jgi:hypothetical protein